MSTHQTTPQTPFPDAPQGSYTSPIPVVRTHLGHALISEWTKIRTVRSTLWTLGIFVLLVVGVGLLVAGQTGDAEYRDTPFTVPAFFGLILGQICLVTLGVLVISSEYGTGLIRTTFTAAPRRHRVLAAKMLVFFALVFVVSAVCVGLVGLVTSGTHSAVDAPPMGGTILRGSLYVSLLGVLALAVGSMLRHSAGAITAMLGVLLLPAILPGFLMLSNSMRSVGEKLSDYNAINSLARIFGLDQGSSGGSQLGLLAGVTAVAVAGAFLLQHRRDV
jgi:ABC-2 type transport system permease protein